MLSSSDTGSDKTYGADFVIVGSGFGGGAAARELARSGAKVLVLERGPWAARKEPDWNPRKILVERHYAGDSFGWVTQYGRKPKRERFNEVVGGNSVFYGGASFRLREKDFARWPLSYSDFEPYYTEAERILEISGASDDPTGPPRSEPYSYPPLERSIPARRIHDAAQDLGLKPFSIPLAINFHNSGRPKCALCNTCDGFPCQIGAKNDVAMTFLDQAVKSGAEVRAGVAGVRFLRRGGEIEALECLDLGSGRTFLLRARNFILAAGTLHSPAILMRSGFEDHRATPVLGRYLMRHCNAILGAVFPFKTNPNQVFHKQVAISDFYEDMRDRYGTATGVIQDIYMPAREVVEHFSPSGMKWITGTLSGYIQNLLCIAEDDPLASNRVALSEDRDRHGQPALKIEHSYTDADYQRRDFLLRQARRVLRRAGGLIFKKMEIDSFSHAVGTLRFGTDEKTSALDLDCRVHGTSNLFVLDGSFMPTSAGVNPSLTIAANSLRVSRKLSRR